MDMEEKVPELTLTPNEIPEPTAEKEETAAVRPQPDPTAGPELESLSEAEQKAVRDFAVTIDVKNSQQILQYGSSAQKSIADFSETVLNSAKTKDLGEVGDMLSRLLTELRGFSAEEEEKKGLRSLFKKTGRSVTAWRARYEKVAANVDSISEELEGQQIVLMKDIEILDQMYQKNLEYFKMLSMYILAGKMHLEHERSTTLASLTEVAKRTELPQDAQAVNDFENLCLRFEKKLHDLELTRMVCLQMAPQIRLLQNNDTTLTEKIQTSIVNTIPLWKSQMLIALGIGHSQAALEAQREVTDMTNELLKKNAENLKTATIEAAKEAERGVVDIETLKVTNESLISTLDEVLQIQADGTQKRREAEAELGRIEGELRQKLLEIRR